MASMRIEMNNKSNFSERRDSGSFANNTTTQRPQMAVRRPITGGVLSNSASISPDQKNPKKKKWWLIILFLIALAIGGGAIYYLLTPHGSKGSKGGIVGTIKENIQEVVKPELEQDENGYTNFLLIGKDTREYSKGLQNTDTIIVGSYNNETGDVILISIPRDTFIQGPNGTSWHKVNSVYANGERRGEFQGVEDLKTVSKTITGLDIHYWAMVDLGGFKTAIDIIGGVDIDVERAFTDYAFPSDGGGGYRTVHFDAGLQHMDGKTALDYARSRKAGGPEGSDYMRARRQQKVIKAFLAKLTSMDTLNLDTILQLQETLSKSVVYSEIDANDIRAGLDQLQKTGEDKVTSIVLDPALGNGQLIYVLPKNLSGGAYAIGPVKGLTKWDEVQTYINGIIEDPALHREAAKVYTYNGGLGWSKVSTESTAMKSSLGALNITFAGNNNADDVTDVVILVTNEKPETLTAIKDYLASKKYTVEIVREIPGFTPRFKEEISVIFGAPAPVEPAETPATDTTTTTE